MAAETKQDAIRHALAVWAEDLVERRPDLDPSPHTTNYELARQMAVIAADVFEQMYRAQLRADVVALAHSSALADPSSSATSDAGR